jgi:diguanylate cyclase
MSKRRIAKISRFEAVLFSFSMDTPRARTAARGPIHWIVLVNFRLRAISFAVVFAGLSLHLQRVGASPLLWSLLALQFLVYPPLLYWRARRAADPRTAELNHMLLDAFVIGAWVAALHFPLWPTFGMCIGCILNMTMTSGWQGSLRAMFACALGMLVAMIMFGADFSPATAWPTTLISVLGVAAHLLVVGNTSYDRNRQLRRTREQLRKGEQALHASNEVLQQQLAEIQALQVKLNEQALRDPMTGLFNRRYLATIVPHELARCARDHVPLCLMMMDIDHFKQVNDTHGHLAGDAVLNSLAALLLASVRSSDVACRYGGEEFLLLLPNMPADMALLRGEQWRAAFAASSVSFGGTTIRATVSIGIALYPAEGSSADALIHCADQALYRAKAQGRNQVVLYGGEAVPVA